MTTPVDDPHACAREHHRVVVLVPAHLKVLAARPAEELDDPPLPEDLARGSQNFDAVAHVGLGFAALPARHGGIEGVGGPCGIGEHADGDAGFYLRGIPAWASDTTAGSPSPASQHVPTSCGTPTI